jgi:hypothetical protein
MAKEILLTQGFVAIVDDEDLDRVSKHKWCAQRTRTSRGTVYAVTMIALGIKRRERVTLHRFVASPKESEMVDHINGNGLDNRRCNLRICSMADNCRNRGKTSRNSSGYKGVSLVQGASNRWFAQIRANHKNIYLGTFNTPEAAHDAYKAAAIKLHGDFAKFN